jgi:transcriptional regulator with XRE-family HTH domain
MKSLYIERIKALRIKRGISQKEMADRLGFGQSNYNKIENGITELSVSNAQEIAEILAVSVSSILGSDEVEKLKIEIEQKDRMIGVLTVLLTEFASGVNTEDNPKRFEDLINTLRNKYPNDSNLEEL